MIGTSHETVNQALTDFALRGWIRLIDKSMPILDSEHPMRRTRQGCANLPNWRYACRRAALAATTRETTSATTVLKREQRSFTVTADALACFATLGTAYATT